MKVKLENGNSIDLSKTDLETIRMALGAVIVLAKKYHEMPRYWSEENSKCIVPIATKIEVAVRDWGKKA